MRTQEYKLIQNENIIKHNVIHFLHAVIVDFEMGSTTSG